VSVFEPPPGTDTVEEVEEVVVPIERPAGKWGAVGMPLERSKDFKTATRRLLARLRPEAARVFAVLLFAFASVTLLVIGPRVLGHATNIIVDGVTGESGIDFAALHRTLLFALGIYVVGALLAFAQSRILAGVVQRAMSQLRADVEEKLNRMPLRYVDRQPRGDLLSRVTNDIDNLAQSLQQTLSQMLTSTLTLIGVVILMFSISPLLAVIALVTIPVSTLTMKAITKRSKQKFIEQ
jgi:ATP-binding cassette subfamily B protein